MNYLIDTNVISELSRKKPDVNVINWLDSIQESQLYISVLTLGELKKGIDKLVTDTDGHQKFICWFDQLKLRFKGRIFPITDTIADCWGSLLAQIGQPVPAIDSLIASTAFYHHCTLVTRNIKDFKAFEIVKLRVINPWDCSVPGTFIQNSSTG